jgi:hypothetical protein
MTGTCEKHCEATAFKIVIRGLEHDVARLKEALAQPEQEPVAWMTINAYGEEDDIHYENPEGHLLEGWTYKPLYTHPPSVKLRRGDILQCIETDELCTVWSTSTTGKTLVKWSANNFGNYTAEQIGELFWLEPKQEIEQEPPQRTEQEPTPEIKYKMIVIDDLHPQGIPVEQWVNQAQRTERNFCSRCGKRTPDLITIHTCTPPKEGT